MKSKVIEMYQYNIKPIDNVLDVLFGWSFILAVTIGNPICVCIASMKIKSDFWLNAYMLLDVIILFSFIILYGVFSLRENYRKTHRVWTDAEFKAALAKELGIKIDKNKTYKITRS